MRICLLPVFAFALLACQSEEGGSDGSPPNGGGTGGTAILADGSVPSTGGQGSGGEGSGGEASAPAPDASGAGDAGDSGSRPDAGAGGSKEAGPASDAGGPVLDGAVGETSDCTVIESCVCEDWQQDACCSEEWDTFCQVTAEQKCGATVNCAATTDGGPGSKGACCAAHAEPGCSEPEVESCICDLLPDCCTDSWDALCVQLYNEQHCGDGVRECVCKDWELDRCCTESWTTLCALTAEEKCGGTPSCG